MGVASWGDKYCIEKMKEMNSRNVIINDAGSVIPEMHGLYREGDKKGAI